MQNDRSKIYMNRRYKLLPQMRDYDRLKPDWVPYLMFINSRGFRSLTCNTDEHGFRFTYKKYKPLDYAAFELESSPKGVIIGGSLAFGVGATDDKSTVASILNQNSSITWFNFGGRAFNSTQEVLLFLMHLPKVEKVLILSGVNNLVAYPFSTNFVPRLGGFFEDSRFYRQMQLDDGFHAIIRVMWQSLREKIRAKIRRRNKLVEMPNTGTDLENRYWKALKILDRDLEIWRILRDKQGFSLIFCLQPFALWMNKVLTEEEEELFTILDCIGGASWRMIGIYLSQTYPQYRSDLEALCHLKEIEFMDTNDFFPKEGWLFCDRVHLTDRGNSALAGIIKKRIIT